jgi:putative acetyltransferase
MKPWHIREEAPGDEPAVAALTAAAFGEAAHSSGTEAAIVDRLRADGDLALSLVADDTGRMLGHAAFSPVRITSGASGWYGLGPVSVLPDWQGQGIGSALIRSGLERLRATGARGCVVLGEPSYYGRFGFAHDPQLAFPGPPPEYFQRLVFAGEPPAGTVRYAPAFG